MNGLDEAGLRKDQFALLSYSTVNLGDEIQSLAAAQFLPHIDAYVDREHTNEFSPENKQVHKAIINGWFMHRPQNWPPSASIKPLIISMHINPATHEAGEAPSVRMLSPTGIDYFKRVGPIGARDLTTLELLQSHGIDAYFSGCLTLTLPRPPVSRDANLIVVNDVHGGVTERIKAVSKKRVLVADQNTQLKDRATRFQAAYDLLETYAKASFVVTTRLHCALPCLAFGTPVLFLRNSADPTRYAGLENLLNACTVSEFLQYDPRAIEFPLPNKRDFVALRRELIRRVEEFTGYPDIRKVSPYQGVLGIDPQIRHVVAAAYRGILHRAPDSSGLRTYSEILRRDGLGPGVEQMIKTLLLSKERLELKTPS